MLAEDANAGNKKYKAQELDEKSLEVIKLIDDSIKKQYLNEIDNGFTSGEDSKLKATHNLCEYSTTYKRKKELLLEGMLSEV